MKYRKSFYCFEMNENYYAIDTERIIPIKINRDTYELLKQINQNVFCSDELTKYKTFPGYDAVVFLQDCDLLFHDMQKCYVKNSFKELNLSVIPTYGCNLKCKYCYSNVKDSNKNISVETVSDAINFFCKNFEFDYCRVDFVSGGEPLLSQTELKNIISKIQDILKYYGKKNLMWLCTNGTLLNDDIIKFFDDNRINLGISLDGAKNVNDSNRVFQNGRGTYEHIQKKINAIYNNPNLTRKIKYLWNSAVITSNTKSLVDVLDNSYDMGFKNIQMKLVWSNENEQRLTVKRAIDLYRELTCYLMQLVKDGKDERFLMMCNENDTYGKILLRIIIQSGVERRCNAGVNKFSLAYDGKLYPCDSFLGNNEYCIGDIYQGFNPKYFEIKQLRVDSNDICKECWARFLCGGDCFYHSFLNNQDINIPDEKNCTITKELIKMGVALIVDLYETVPDNMEKIYNILSRRTKMMEPQNENRNN